MDGNYYNEIEQKDYRKRDRMPFVKSYFKTYTINIDLAELSNVDMDEKSIDNAYTMLNFNELNDTLVDLSQQYSKYLEQTGHTQVRRTELRKLDSTYRMKTDTVKTAKKDVLANFSTENSRQILDFAKTSATSAISYIKSRKADNSQRVKSLSKYEIALHEKFTLAVGCIVLFFVGAPLGAIIRKGGLGLPIVIGVALFLTYHFIGIFAKNSAEDGSLPAWIASWLSTLILFPLGAYLTYRATTDQGLLDIDSIVDPIKKLFRKIAGIKTKK